ncbi:DUF1566 domain-containing protein [Arcobacter arenosus]|uniref:DUF1566 domain-containing protein n=1 Tax=Arcobacter arenosus TaxID=2576037 RepID=A0A5R8Y3S7_9BACT|nr:DUF1566 domain-containing protein [Arcobacter arenosus]TLP39521.1 DUF1566 domain-containing protein [Arcobacter arenosus]
MRYLFLVLLLISFSFSNDFRRDGIRKVVVDSTAKLMWIDNFSNVKNRLNHSDATDYCESLSYAGYDNWRLPTIEEFELIVDKTNERSYINRAFKFNMPVGYWASKAHWRTFWFYADYMFFVSGTPYYDSRHKKKFVRCVRDIN